MFGRENSKHAMISALTDARDDARIGIIVSIDSPSHANAAKAIDGFLMSFPCIHLMLDYPYYRQAFHRMLYLLPGS